MSTAPTARATAVEIENVLDIAHGAVFTISGTHVVLGVEQAHSLLALAQKAKDAAIVIDEVDEPEILAALSIAAQVAKAVGDKVQADHYGGIRARLATNAAQGA